MKNKVSIINCSSYNQSEINEAVKKSLELLNIDLKNKKSILLKPNVLGPYTPDKYATTHPAFISAVCSLIDPETIIYIGDSSGTDILNYTDKSLKRTGIKALEEKFPNVKVLSFNSLELQKINSNSEYFQKLYLPKILEEVDMIINLPKLKTHTFMQYTGAIKNLFGCIPGGAKTKMHKVCKTPENFAKMLLNLHDIIKPQLNIIDGVWGMEGNGPNIGDPKQFNLVLASTNAMALDLVTAKIIGFQPEDVFTNNLIQKRGILLNDIEVLGGKDLRIDCKKPIHAEGLAHRLPEFIKKSLYELKLEIDTDKCKKCKICYNACPVKAIKINNKGLKIDSEQCIECHCCHELCPYGAVGFKDRFLRKVVKKVKSYMIKF
jgi:uncharacterized protein (DUF362 family)/NAD-dependent dihydropyrimidine dehydrogenase PreA subunit